MDKKIILVSIFIVGVAVGVAGFYLFQDQKGLTLEDAGKVSIDFINKALKQDNVTASLMSVAEESGLYKIHLKIEEKEYDSFISKDGKYLFSMAFNLEEEQKTQDVASETPALETLAKCLTDSGAKFYGASWCSWCKQEKELFGEAAQYLPYIECIDEQTNEMNSTCKAEGIATFPTWEFNGEKTPGFQTLEQLSESSGCQLY